MNSSYIFLLVCCLAVGAVSSRSVKDSLIVANTYHLEAIINGSSIPQVIGLRSYNASALTGLAYDPSSQRLYFSDKYKDSVHIYSIYLNLTNLTYNHTFQDIAKKNKNQMVEGLAYDPVEGYLIWSDGEHKSIYRKNIKTSQGVEKIHSMKHDQPQGLVVDPCTRMMYWVNEFRLSIDRSTIDGRDHVTIIDKDLYMPVGLALDLAQQKIYWANNKPFKTFTIERSYVDGTERELVFDGANENQFVFGLTVSDEFIYWTDLEQRTLWSYPKEGFKS